MYSQFIDFRLISQIHFTVEFPIFRIVDFDVLFVDRGIGQVSKLVVELIGIVVVASESEIVFRVEPDL